MMEHIQNQMKQAANQSHGEIAKPRIGIVSGYDPNTYSVKVKLQPDDTETAWLPIKSAWVGNGWGMFCPPSIGDSVGVEFTDGDINSGCVNLAYFNDEDRPLPVPVGEFWLVHKTGSMLKFLENGNVELIANADLNINAVNVAITSSTLKHNGVNVGSTHHHGNVQNGGGNTGVPA